jgi:ABC-type uncharacterized transport system auxiliary subunit
MTIKQLALACLLATTAMLAGCQREQQGPYELQGHIFVFNYRMAQASYMITLRRTASVAEGTHFIAQFENPAGGAPVSVARRI